MMSENNLAGDVEDVEEFIDVLADLRSLIRETFPDRQDLQAQMFTDSQKGSFSSENLLLRWVSRDGCRRR